MTMSTEVQSWIGLEAMDSDEDKVGKMEEVRKERIVAEGDAGSDR